MIIGQCAHKYKIQQVCLTLGWSSVVFALCLLIEKIADSDPMVTYSYRRVTYSEPKVTYSDPTHLPLPQPTSPDLHLAISQVKLNLWVGGGWVVVVVVVATNFSVSSRQGFKL